MGRNSIASFRSDEKSNDRNESRHSYRRPVREGRSEDDRQFREARQFRLLRWDEIPSRHSDRMKKATIETSRGTLTADLFEKDAPKTIANFEKLANSGFYDGTKFHRVIQIG